MKTSFLGAVAVLLIVAFFACQKAGPKTEAKAATEVGKTVVALIDPTAAQAAIRAWNQTRPQIIAALAPNLKSDSIYLARGFHINLHDLTAIVNNVGDTSKIYAMLGIRNNALGQPQIELFFQAPDKNGVVRYHNFTNPCPRQCPE